MMEQSKNHMMMEQSKKSCDDRTKTKNHVMMEQTKKPCDDGTVKEPCDDGTVKELTQAAQS